MRHQDADDLLPGIDPVVGFGGAGPAKFAHRAGDGRVGHIQQYARPQTKAIAGGGDAANIIGQQRGGNVVGVHQLDNLATQNPFTVKRAAVEQHLGKAQIVIHGGEETMTATRKVFRAVGRIGGGDIDLLIESAHPRFRQLGQRDTDADNIGQAIHSGEAILLVSRHAKIGVSHAQRGKELGLEEIAQRLTR